MSQQRLVVVAQWLGLGAAVGVLCGAASALFLWLLDAATAYRSGHRWLVLALPAAGLVIGWIYDRHGRSIRGGTSLVIETARDGGPAIPLRMAPMVLLGTVATHLFGGSAGREGTAVQMGASLGDGLAQRLRLAPALRRQLVVAGIAGGFGSVFGTPVAGAVFALEVMVVGQLRAGAVVPALVAAVVGDVVTRGLGIAHTGYPSAPELALSPRLVASWLVFAAAVAAVTAIFIELTHAIKRRGERHLPRLPLRLFVGGLVVIGLWLLIGSDDYLGLGVPTLVRAFVDPSLPAEAFALKLLFTAVTVGAGFLGGEVTPLFVIGAALGNAMAQVLGIPLALGAGVGMAAMFGTASNAPLALSIMAVELLGVAVLPHVAIVCVVAYLLAARRTIYPGQRFVGGKLRLRRRQQ